MFDVEHVSAWLLRRRNGEHEVRNVRLASSKGDAAAAGLTLFRNSGPEVS
jgi:hypothetical protein